MARRSLAARVAAPLAVVSGGGSGLGREIAGELARRGYALALLGRRREPLERALAELGGGGGPEGRGAAAAPRAGGRRPGRTAGGSLPGLALACDVRDALSVERAAAVIADRWGAADVVVPAAGVAWIAPLEETSVERFRATLETNLTGTFLLLRALLPAMKRHGRGRIFVLLSVAARRGFAGWSAYCASKWGLAGLAAALREELSGSGVRLTALYLGATDTPIWDGLPGPWDRTAMMQPAEVARAVGFALDAAPDAAVEEIHLGPAGGAL